jgi:hypothetical protein
MPWIRVASWVLVVLTLALWSLYNRRIAFEQRQRLLEEREIRPHVSDRQ